MKSQVAIENRGHRKVPVIREWVPSNPRSSSVVVKLMVLVTLATGSAKLTKRSGHSV